LPHLRAVAAHGQARGHAQQALQVVILTDAKRSHGTRGQNISSQVQRRPEDATRNVNQPVGQGIEL
jgi:hypothetical protein